MSLKYEEVEELCKLKSITECIPEDPRFPMWVEDLERFGGRFVKGVVSFCVNVYNF